MPRIHLVEGPVGAGKSTFASALAERHRAPHLDLDDWMATLFRPDRPEQGVMEWYAERKDRLLEQMWKVAQDVLASGSDVVLELGLIRQQMRLDFYDRVEAADQELTVHVLEASREVRRERVRQRNSERGPTFSMEVPDAFFELASDLWEPPDDFEREGRDLRLVSTEA